MAFKDFLPQPLRKYFAPREAKSAWGISTTGANLLQLPLNLSRRLSGSDITMREAVAHELIFRCLEKITDVAQDARPLVERKGAKEWKADDRHPLTRQLLRPNPEQSWPEFWAYLLREEHVWGRWYVEILRARSNAVVGFQPVDVRWVTEIGQYSRSGYLYDLWDEGARNIGKILGYTIDDNVTHREVLPENFISYKLFDRNSVLAGLSPVRVALASVGVDASLNRFADSFLVNGGPTGVLTLKNRTLSEEEAARLQAKWRYSYQAGGPSEKSIAVLDEDATYQPVGTDLDKISADDLKQHVEANVCAAMGVPAILVGAYVGLRWANQRAGQKEAMRDFWINKMSPLFTRYREIFSQRFLIEYEDPFFVGLQIRCNWDLSECSAAKEDADAVANRTTKLYGTSLVTLNEAREAVGFDPVPDGDALKDQRASDMAAARAQNEPMAPKDNSKRINGLVNGAEPFQSKSETKRQPTPLEQKQAPVVEQVQDFAREAMLVVLRIARKRMLSDALAQAADGKTVRVLPTNAEAELCQATLQDLYLMGKRTVSDNAKGQKDLKSVVARIVKAVLATLGVRVAARVVDEVSRAEMREMSLERALEIARTVLAEEPAAYVEELASGAAYEAVGAGRLDELKATMQVGDLFIYSAILDKNTCGPCKADDLKEANDPALLPHAPNPLCAGRWRCRCMIVIARD